MYARHIGRVGALAVALGVGAAVATGYGSGFGTGIARADDDTSANDKASTASPADSPSDPASTPADTQTTTTPSTTSTGDHTADTDATDHSDTGTGSTDSATDAEKSTNDASKSADDIIGAGGDTGTAVSTAPTDPPTSEKSDPPVSATEQHGSTSQPQAQPDVHESVPQVQADTSADNSSKNAHDVVAPSVMKLASVPGTDSQALQSFATTSAASRFSAMVVAPTAQPASPLAAFTGAVVSVATSVVGILLSPFLAPGPGAPAEPPLLWALLGWVNREISRTFFNRTPNAVADSVTTSEDIPKAIDVLANDTDDDPLTVTSFTQPTNGAVVHNADGTFTYTPKANWSGTDTFTYTLSDESAGFHLHGLLSLFTGQTHTATATVTITVGAVNDPPVADNDSYTVPEDGVLTVVAGSGVLNGDTDIDSAGLTAVLGTGPASGTLNLGADGSFTYKPNADFNGTDSFTYRASDGTATSNLATVTITVQPVNDAPVAKNDTATVDRGGEVTISVVGNDTDVDGTVDASTVTVTQPTHGSAIANNDGTITYTSNGDRVPTDTFTYTVKDNSGATSNTATVTVTVDPVNDPPVNPVGDIAETTDEDHAVSGNLLTLSGASDPDGDDLDVNVIGTGLHGTLSVDNETGAFTYTPMNLKAGETVVDTFTYTVSDGTAATTPATLKFTVTGLNDAPLGAGNTTQTTDEDHPVSGNLLTGFTDPDGDDLDVNLTGDGIGQYGALVLNSETGDYTYTPNNLKADVTGVDTFTYTVTDGTAMTTPRTLTIIVTGLNDAPLGAGNTTQTTDEDHPVSGNLLTGFTDPDGDDLDVNLTGDGIGQYGALVLNSETGDYTYTPNNLKADVTGVDTFTYTVTDGTAMTTPRTLTIIVTGLNDAPVGVNGIDLHTHEDNPLTGNLLTGVTDPDGDTLTVTVRGLGTPKAPWS